MSETSWEAKARILRGGMRRLRASVDITLEEGSDDWQEELRMLREAINEILQEADSE